MTNWVNRCMPPNADRPITTYSFTAWLRFGVLHRRGQVCSMCLFSHVQCLGVALWSWRTSISPCCVHVYKQDGKNTSRLITFYLNTPTLHFYFQKFLSRSPLLVWITALLPVLLSSPAAGQTVPARAHRAFASPLTEEKWAHTEPTLHHRAPGTNTTERSADHYPFPWTMRSKLGHLKRAESQTGDKRGTTGAGKADKAARKPS